MKCEVIFETKGEEKVVIHARESRPQIHALAEEIRRLTEEFTTDFIGYNDRKEIVKLAPADIYCLTVLDNRVCAVCKNETFRLKERLYVLEARLPDTFVKVNQSCIANINHIERFDASISGTLKLRFKNGYTDYVSRRQMKTLKERLGI